MSRHDRWTRRCGLLGARCWGLGALSGVLVGSVLVPAAAQAPSASERLPQQSSEQPPEPSSPFDDLLEGLPKRPQTTPPAGSAGSAGSGSEGTVDGPQVPSGEADPLVTAYQAMQQAGRRLQRREEVPAAIDAQQQAIDALDALLEQLQQPSNQPAGGESREQASAPESQSPGEPSNDPASPSSQDSESQDSESGASESGDQDPATGDGGQPNEASNRSGAADLDPAALQRTFQQGVWGHLPERVRQQLQAARPDEFHPRYRDAIADYFRQLAQ